MRLNLRLIVTALVACTLVAACSGGGDNVADTPAADEAAPATPTPEAVATPTVSPEPTPAVATEAPTAAPVSVTS